VAAVFLMKGGRMKIPSEYHYAWRAWRNLKRHIAQVEDWGLRCELEDDLLDLELHLDLHHPGWAEWSAQYLAWLAKQR
jgi:hypothetical protein